MSDETNLVEETAAEPLQPVAEQPPVESPEQLAQTPNRDVASTETDAQRLREEIREDLLGELDRRLGSTAESIVSRLRQSQRASNEAWAQKQYQEMSDYIDQTFERMVAQGRLTAEAAEEQKELEKSRLREQVDQQVVNAADQRAPVATPPTETDVVRQWDKTWQAVANEYDLDSADPEWKDFSGMQVQGTDWDQWVSSLRKGARQISKQKEKRLAQEMLAAAKANEERQTLDAQRWQQAQSRAVPVDTGGGQRPVEPADPAQELSNLMKKGPPDDPKALAKYLRSLKTLNARVRG
jgi:hypothetical protein